ncbi:MAG: single-stranded DNA-binding protein [Candidatus Bathyarchaeota archaeon]|nr:single-stranded DNA-binding protein [Candidatus Bathyarchaeota archaeon]
MKVGSLKPNLRNVDLTVKIVNVGASRAVPSKRGQRQHLIAEALVGDETGSVVLTLWDDQINLFKAGDVVKMRGGYTTLFKGSLRLNIGRTGHMEKVDKEVGEVNTKNNLSEETHIRIPWRLSEGRPFRRRRRR